tara:strand:+ start:763 stop:3468 length:2706 start_codon:yes stop_codon:yes gene_type:complete
MGSSSIPELAADLAEQERLEPILEWLDKHPAAVTQILDAGEWGCLHAQFAEILGLRGFSEGDGSLTPCGRVWLAKNYCDFEALCGQELNQIYFIEGICGEGRWSIVYQARHKLLPIKFALKVSTARDSVQHVLEQTNALYRLSCEELVMPQDVFPVSVPLVDGGAVSAVCVAFPFIEGETIREFCRTKRPLSSNIVREYLDQVGRTLGAMHAHGQYHGDLNEHNILLQAHGENFNFKIVDLVNPNPDLDEHTRERIDFTDFKENLGRLLALMPRKRISTQKHLGDKLYVMVKALFSNQIADFASLVHALQNDRLYKAFERQKAEFISAKFSEHSSQFRLRHEEFSDISVARSYFVPFVKIFERLAKFGSAIIEGHRGSGKSSYLAALAFQPSANKHIVDPTQKFGVFFACRQGEFKIFRALSDRANRSILAELKTLIVTKVIRKTIRTVRAGISEVGAISDLDFNRISNFFTSHYPPGVTINFRRSIPESIRDLEEALMRYEVGLVDVIFRKTNRDVEAANVLNETVLIEFFSTLRESMPVFATTQFFVLFDDAGEPNVPKIVQKVVNELLRASNHVYCIKLSTEKRSYLFEDSDGKKIEAPHDYEYFDLGYDMLIKDSDSSARTALKSYFEEFLRLRLSEYRSQSIQAYLDSKPEARTIETLIGRLAGRDSKPALYSGWDVIWQIADRTPRQLIEIVEGIFEAGGISEKSEVAVIDPKVQDRVVRGYSERKLRILRSLPGFIKVNTKKRPLGIHLEEVIISFGRYSRYCLMNKGVDRAERKGRPVRKFHEVLAIEIDNQILQSPDSVAVLDALVRFAIFDDSRRTNSLDDGMSKGIYVLNRVFCPALQISFRRVNHWRLSGTRFNAFLTSPYQAVHKALQDAQKQSKGGEDNAPESFLDI